MKHTSVYRGARYVGQVVQVDLEVYALRNTNGRPMQVVRGSLALAIKYAQEVL